MDNPNPDSYPLTGISSGAGKYPSPPLTTPEQPPSSSLSYSTQQNKAWKEAQDSLKKSLITEDDFEWKSTIGENGFEALKYVGGVDISFSEEEEAVACGTIVVVELHSLRVVYEDFSLVGLRVPYVPGFLAFREAPVLLGLLERMRKNSSPFYPQVLMVDGNGLLHPRGFGLACHLGVMANIPAIGIGKNLHRVDGLTLSGVKELLKARDLDNEDFTALIGDSGQVWGAAMRSTEGSSKPIFVSIGHRISLDTAIAIVKMTCKYRVPEPIRQADIRSRDYLRKHRL